MPADIVLVDPPEELWRIEWKEPPLRYSFVSASDAALEDAGNRFDIPGVGVLYAATRPVGAFAETTAQFRPSASLIAKMAVAANDGQAPLTPGQLDATWRLRRTLRSLSTINPLPLVDIEAAETHSYLTTHAARLLISLGIPNLDVPSVRGPSRALTRGLATWIYNRRNGDDGFEYGGIRYVSRLGDYECWAIFDGSQVEPLTEGPIEIDDPDLVAVAQRHNITLS